MISFITCSCIQSTKNVIKNNSDFFIFKEKKENLNFNLKRKKLTKKEKKILNEIYENSEDLIEFVKNLLKEKISPFQDILLEFILIHNQLEDFFDNFPFITINLLKYLERKGKIQTLFYSLQTVSVFKIYFPIYSSRIIELMKKDQKYFRKIVEVGLIYLIELKNHFPDHERDIFKMFYNDKYLWKRLITCFTNFKDLSVGFPKYQKALIKRLIFYKEVFASIIDDIFTLNLFCLTFPSFKNNLIEGFLKNEKIFKKVIVNVESIHDTLRKYKNYRELIFENLSKDPEFYKKYFIENRQETKKMVKNFPKLLFIEKLKILQINNG